MEVGQPCPKSFTMRNRGVFPFIHPPIPLNHSGTQPAACSDTQRSGYLDFTDKNFIPSGHIPVVLSARWRDYVSITQTPLWSSQDWKGRVPRPQKMKRPRNGPRLRVNREPLLWFSTNPSRVSRIPFLYGFSRAPACCHHHTDFLPQQRSMTCP